MNRIVSESDKHTISAECRERTRAGQLQVLGRLRSREPDQSVRQQKNAICKYSRCRLGNLASGCRNHGGAVDQVSPVVPQNGKLGHGRPEARHHVLLLVYKALPDASRPAVACEGEVGLQTELAGIFATGQGEG
jgi:hypothetical protein